MPAVESGFPDECGSFDPMRLLTVGSTLNVKIGFDVEFQSGSDTNPDRLHLYIQR